MYVIFVHVGRSWFVVSCPNIVNSMVTDGPHEHAYIYVCILYCYVLITVSKLSNEIFFFNFIKCNN